MSQADIDKMSTFLSAFNVVDVKSAIKQWAKTSLTKSGKAESTGWTLIDKDKSVPVGYEYMKINGKIFIRKIPVSTTTTKKEQKAEKVEKQDLSMEPTEKKCWICDEFMAWEPICPGCKLGKIGFAGRFVCMNDMDHEFYVTRPGITLDNK